MSTPTDEMTDPTTTTSQGQNPPPPPPPGGNWRTTPVWRIPDDDTDDPERGRLGGVIAGLCRAYGFDLRSTRIAVVIAAIVFPVTLLAYVAAWVLLPSRPEDAAPIGDIVRDRRRLPVLIAIGLVLVAGSLGSFGAWFLFRGAPWGLALVALGVLLWLSSGLGRRSSPPASGASGEHATGDAVRSGFAPPSPHPATAATATTAATTAAMPSTTLQPRRRRRRMPLGWVSLAVAAVFIGVVSVVEAAGGWQAPALWIAVAALGIVTAGLALSAAVNRSWLPLMPLVVVASAITFLSVAQPRLDGGLGERSVAPLTVEVAERPVRLGAGELEIDLRAMPATDMRITAEVGIGRLHVIVPADAELRLETDLGAGVVQVDGADIASGMRQSDTRNVDARSGEATHVIVLDLRVGMGQIAVDRAR